MSWWRSVAGKLPENIRQLPGQIGATQTTADILRKIQSKREFDKPVEDSDSSGSNEEVSRSRAISVDEEEEVFTNPFPNSPPIGSGDIGLFARASFVQRGDLRRSNILQTESLSPSLTSDDLQVELDKEKESLQEEILDLDLDHLTFEGWLAKQTVLTTKNNRTPWKTRYFILKQTCIFYYSIQLDFSIKLELQDWVLLSGDFHNGDLVAGGKSLPPLEDITQMPDFNTQSDTEDLSNVLPVKIEGTQKIGYRLTLVSFTRSHSLLGKNTTDYEIINFATQTEAERSSWIESFKQIENGNYNFPEKEGWIMISRELPRQKTVKRVRSASQMPARTAQPQLTGRSRSPSQIGTVERKMGPWNLKYYKIRGKTLDLQSRIKRGNFHLVPGTVVTVPEKTYSDDKEDIILSIQNPPQAGGKILNLAAEAPSLRNKWLKVLTLAVDALNDSSGMYSVGNVDSTESSIYSDGFNQQPSVVPTELLEYSTQIHQIVKERKIMLDKLVKGTTVNSSPSFKPKQKVDANNVPYTKIMSLDGGGMRGIMNCIILDRLLEKYPKLLDSISFFAGTSNGGMLAMAFALGYTPKICRTLLEMAGTVIFAGSKKTGAAAAYDGYVNLKKAKFSLRPLGILLSEICGNIKLKEIPDNKFVLLPSMLMDNRAEQSRAYDWKYYHNLPIQSEDNKEHKLGDELCVDVVMRTISAPTYFPSYQRHVDGGMFCHSPAAAAITLTVSPQPQGLGKQLTNVVLISLGTGKVNHYYPEEVHDWGFYQWVPKLSAVLWDGMVGSTDWTCKNFLGDFVEYPETGRYCRFDPELQNEISLDDPLEIPRLVETAKKLDLTKLEKFIEKWWTPEELGISHVSEISPVISASSTSSLSDPEHTPQQGED